MKTPTATIYRGLALDVRNVTVRADGNDGEKLLEMDIAFASETPVERLFGTEELEVTSKAARLDRVAQGVAPVLDNHSSGAVVGRVLSVTIGSDRIARARIRFSRSAAARDVVQDVVDGIRQGISFGYRVHKMELIESGDAGDKFRVVDWELFEITIASMPADPSVGVHRSFEESAFAPALNQRHRSRKERTMTISLKQLAKLPEDEFEEEISGWASAKQVSAREFRRRDHIETICREFHAPEGLCERALRQGWNEQKLQDAIREDRSKGSEPLSPPDTFPGIDVRDAAGYSFVGHALEQYAGQPGPNSEIAAYITRNDDRPLSRNSFRTSPELIALGYETREIGKTTGGGAGATLVGVDHRGDMLIDIFRNKAAAVGLGVTMMPGLIGDQSFPKQNVDTGTEWVGEAAGAGTPGEPGFTALTMSPKTIRARVDMTRRMRLQSSPMVDQIVQSQFFTGMALAIDAAIINGAGGAIEPEGIMNTSGVGTVAYSTASALAEYQALIDLAGSVADANADVGRTAFLISTALRGRYMTKFFDPGAGLSIWQNVVDRDVGSIAGWRAATSNNVPRNLGVGTNEHAVIYGDWSNILLGLWSSVDIIFDEVSLGDSGGLRLIAFQDVDVLIRNAPAFAVTQLIPTA